ncbi:hypothetical protein LOS8367_03739 [Limimaricola soesokkakensis]|uniref:Uncharacterized protein n=1 Tax=Limimaricola soesokkakensis TaxID=1343159 RepID=A0A1X7AB76_9RHOB|nr:hypothetical protein LOS8367_03739 [Limimaricola soesokkakensis]
MQVGQPGLFGDAPFFIGGDLLLFVRGSEIHHAAETFFGSFPKCGFVRGEAGDAMIAVDLYDVVHLGPHFCSGVSTGKPAALHAFQLPGTLRMDSKPCAASRLAAMLARKPLAQ